MQLILTCPNGPLEVNVKNVTFEIVDRSRASSAAGVVTINRTFGAQNAVSDVDRYRFRLTDDRIALRPHPVCEISPYSNRYYDMPPEDPNSNYNKTIVIVLESPHKDEYLRDVSQPIAPAQGSTGSKIQGYLDCVLRTSPALCDELEDQETRVVLANPIQFQTSLASVIQPSNWQRVRNAVWRKIWSCQSMRDNFNARMESYSPDVIINACTRNLKNEVRTFLYRRFGAPHRYEAHHPSYWNNCTQLWQLNEVGCSCTARE